MGSRIPLEHRTFGQPLIAIGGGADGECDAPKEQSLSTEGARCERSEHEKLEEFRGVSVANTRRTSFFEGGMPPHPLSREALLVYTPHRPRFALLPPPLGGGQCVAIGDAPTGHRWGRPEAWDWRRAEGAQSPRSTAPGLIRNPLVLQSRSLETATFRRECEPRLPSPFLQESVPSAVTPTPGTSPARASRPG